MKDFFTIMRVDLKTLKRFILPLFILMQVENGYSQSMQDSIYKSVLENSLCHSRIIDTDSVYSFLNAAHLDEIGFGHVFLLKSTPFPIHDLKDVPGFLQFIDSTRVLDTDDNLSGFFTSILDSATTFKHPITNWDISRFPEEDRWLLYNEKNPIYDLIAATTWFDERKEVSDFTFNVREVRKSKRNGSRNKKQQQAFEEGVEYAQVSGFKRRLDISMSVPVFDKDYKYALLFIANNRSRNFGEEGAFILYQRDSETGWKVYASGNMHHYTPKAINGKILLRL